MDHFLLTRTIFPRSVGRTYVIHDVDNLSNHEPIAFQLLLEAKHIGFCDRIHAPRVSWDEANDSDLQVIIVVYSLTVCVALSYPLTFSCVLICNVVILHTFNLLITTRGKSQMHVWTPRRPPIKIPVIDNPAVEYLAGRQASNHYEKNHYSGMQYT